MPALAGVLVVALALLAAWAEAAHAQETYPEVEMSWVTTDFSIEEGFSRGLRVVVDRPPERRAWFRVEVIHHGGANDRDYWLGGLFLVYPDHHGGMIEWNTTADGVDDDCESVELRLVSQTPGVTASGKVTVRIIDIDGVAVDCGDGGGDGGDVDDSDGGGGDVGDRDGGGGDDGVDEPPVSDCTLVAPHRSGPTGGFTVRPAPGRNSVSLTCGGRTTEYMAEDGLVTRLVESSCRGTGLQLTGAAPGGWYWQHGDRNAAVVPLVCSEALGGPSAVVPGGVTAEVTDGGTLIRHDTARLIGIVPHLAGNDCAEYVTPYWQGDGGVVVRPAEGRETVRVRVQCGRTYSTMTPSAGEDGVITELVRKSYCTDDEGNPKQGRLTVTGAAPGGWYWIRGESNAAVSPLMCADLLGGPEAVDPGGVVARSTEDGTYFEHERDNLIGVVPHLALDGKED